MTEQDAMKKGCPLFCVVTALAAQVQSFRFANKSPGNCQGGECMMWRWDKNEMRHPDSGRVIEVKNADTGYCGLAGVR